MTSPVLQVIDNFLLPIQVADVLLLVFIIGAVVSFIRQTPKILGLQLLIFGLLLLLLPGDLVSDGRVWTDPVFYKFAGLMMVVVAPVLIAVSRR